MNPKCSICLLRRELKFDVSTGLNATLIRMERITFTTRFLGRVDVVDLCDLLVGVLPRTISKVNIDVDTTGVVEALSSRALRREGTRKEELQQICVLSSLEIQTLPPAKKII